MSTARDSNDLPRVAAQAAWVRRLAVALAHDVHAGEDIAQDALLAASRGHGIADLRAWLAGTVRNLARLRRRGDERRAARELRGARTERVDDPALAFERLELQEALLGAVRELSEPYRTAVLLRWFEGLEPEEIARRTDTPVRTVQTRLHRALAQLRETLERRSQGDRSRWLAAWLPALSKSSTGWKWLLLMELKTKLAITGLSAAAVLTLWIATRPATDESTGPAPETVLAQPPEVPARTADPMLEGDAPTLAIRNEQSQLADAAESAPAPTAKRAVHGRVIDVDGAPIPHQAMVFRPTGHDREAPGAHTISDSFGLFELEITVRSGELGIDGTEWMPVYRTEVVSPDPPDGYVVVAGRPRVVRGRVVESTGQPIPEPHVWFGPPGRGEHGRFAVFQDPLRESLGIDLAGASLLAWDVRGAGDGSFEIRCVEGISGFVIGASAQGFQVGESNPPEAQHELTLVLRRNIEPEDGMRIGTVLDPEGRGVSKAWVRLGSNSTRTDEQGRFLIRVEGAPAGARLIAVHPDWQPVLQPCLSASPMDPGAWPDPLVLRFREPLAGIAGVVVDRERKLVAGVEVLVLDPLLWDELLAPLGEPAPEGGQAWSEVFGNHPAVTDADGRFQLHGLVLRSYRLLAKQPHTLELGFSAPIAAGTLDAVLVIGSEHGTGLCAGRIVDLHGTAIPRALVTGLRKLPGAKPGETLQLDTGWAEADDEGHFAIANLSLDVDTLLVRTEPGTPDKLVALPRNAARDALELAVPRSAHVKIEIQTAGLSADAFAFLDTHSERLQIGAQRGGGGWVSYGGTWPIAKGKTEVVVVSEEALTLVLLLKDKEVARLPIRLDPASPNVLQP